MLLPLFKKLQLLQRSKTRVRSFFFLPNVLGSQGSIFSERSSTFIKDYVMNTMRSLTAWEAMSERQLFI